MTDFFFFLPVLFQSSYTFKVICVLRKSIYESACGPLHDSFLHAQDICEHG